MSNRISRHRSRRAAPWVLSLALIACPALAQGTISRVVLAVAESPAPPGGENHSGENRSTARVEQRIQEMHDRLKITPAQQSQWAPFADMMRQNAQRMDTLIQGRTRSGATLNAVDDMKSYAEMARVHAEDVQRLVPVFEQLYAAMTPEQKLAADRTFREFQPHDGRPGRHG